MVEWNEERYWKICCLVFDLSVSEGRAPGTCWQASESSYSGLEVRLYHDRFCCGIKSSPE